MVLIQVGLVQVVHLYFYALENKYYTTMSDYLLSEFFLSKCFFLVFRAWSLLRLWCLPRDAACRLATQQFSFLSSNTSITACVLMMTQDHGSASSTPNFIQSVPCLRAATDRKMAVMNVCPTFWFGVENLLNFPLKSHYQIVNVIAFTSQ